IPENKQAYKTDNGILRKQKHAILKEGKLIERHDGLLKKQKSETSNKGVPENSSRPNIRCLHCRSIRFRLRKESSQNVKIDLSEVEVTVMTPATKNTSFGNTIHEKHH
ncbi:hypothetical protein L9F63_020107, partial [Diploptera punctata]